MSTELEYGRWAIKLGNNWEKPKKDVPLTWRQMWDRFGGGWAWKLGIQMSRPKDGGFTVIFSLIWTTVTVSRERKVK